MQSIREREAAETRARAKHEHGEEDKNSVENRQEPAEDYGIEQNIQNSDFKPTVLLRNNQTSGEASGGDAIIHAETIENDGYSTSDLGEETNVVSKDDRNTTMLSKSDTENIIHPTETDIPKNEESLKIIDEFDIEVSGSICKEKYR